ncbi:MAG TPA: di-heme oxidoredictase family protein, partial [Polyangiales bacterium]
CAGQLTEIQEDVANFNAFMTFLAPPARNRTDDDADLDAADASAPPGRKLFDKVRCADCHIRQAFVTPDNPANGVPGDRRFRPFSDFLLHDMGSLGDQIGSQGDKQASTRMMRTAPLWGIRFRPQLLHDARASDVPSAIAAHDGQGAISAKAFSQLGSADKQTLVQFVLSL